MQLPKIVEVKGIRVLTTHQIAESYDVKEIQISQNFKNNRQRFLEGKHYISLSGDELRAFKNQLEKNRSGQVKNISPISLDRKRRPAPRQVPEHRQSMAGI